MKFDLPNAVAAMNNVVAAVGEDGDSWEIVGDPLTKVVDEVVPAYNEKLDLKLDPSAGDKRAEICTVRWGKIDKDIARLGGLVAAVRNVAAVIKSGKETIAHEWKGESYEAFRAQIEKVEKTLDDYATAMETTAAGMKSAIDGTRQMFTTYRDDALEQHLALPGKFSPPQDWRRMNHDDASYLADQCISHGNMLTDSFNCVYDDDPWRGIIDQKLVNKRLFDQLEKWDCTNNGEVVTGQYNYVVSESYEERKHIRDKIHNWYVATDELKTRVREAFDAALENLRIIAEVKVFSALSVPGATAPAGAPSGDPGPGTGGGSPGPGAGYPGPGGGGGGEVAMPSPGPAPEPEPMPEPAPVEPAAAEPDTAQATDPAATEDAATVSIKDGDRTISVSSPDGQGHVKLTVDDGSGTPKSYSLDFDAASGMGSRPGTEGQEATPEDGVEQVPARSDGKCVIQDGDVTITAERPLFSPDSISVTVDDGTGSPKSYTLDFPEEADTAAASTQPEEATGAQPATNGAVPGAAASSQAAATPVAAQPETGEPAAEQEPTAEPGEQEPAAEREPATSATPGPAAQPVATGQETHAQAWTSDQGGSLSGVLEADQPEGEAGLASVPDDSAKESSDAMGMAGAGLPMMGGATGGGGEPGRAGSGWSVHGDLFDSGEPVYSMHGVLGDDDLESREAQ
jgi:uncharacterized protein YukE